MTRANLRAEVARALNENDEEWLRSHQAEEIEEGRINKRCEGWSCFPAPKFFSEKA